MEASIDVIKRELCVCHSNVKLGQLSLSHFSHMTIRLQCKSLLLPEIKRLKRYIQLPLA